MSAVLLDRIAELQAKLRGANSENRELMGKNEQLAAYVLELREALSEAADAIEGWGAYAGEYFKQKHDLAGDIARARAALERQP